MPKAVTDVPTLFQNGAAFFQRTILLANNVILGLSGVALVLAIVCLAVQLVRPDQRVLIKRTKQVDGTLIVPHSQVLAPLMIAIFAAVSIACEVVLNVFLKSSTARASIQRLSLLLPMPLLWWAWISAFSNVFAWHMTPISMSLTWRRLRFKPIVLNLVCWITPMLVFAAQLAVVNVWPILQDRASALDDLVSSLKKDHDASDPLLSAATCQLYDAVALAESFYQASWGIWAAAYGLCWAMYATYSLLLLSLLYKQMRITDNMMTTPKLEPSASLPEIRHPTSMLSSGIAKLVPLQNRATESPWAQETSTCGSHTSPNVAQRVLSRRDLLRRNTYLIYLELISFSVFTLCWSGLATTKCAMGYKILNDPKAGPITLLGELYLSTIFGIIVTALLLRRAVNILRSRKGLPSQATECEKPATLPYSADKLSFVPQPILPPTACLANRRGTRSMQISLNMGDLVVIPSPLSTPLTERRTSWQSQTALPIVSYFGPTLSQASMSDKGTPYSLHEKEPHGKERRGSADTTRTIDEQIAAVKAREAAVQQHKMPLLHPTLSRIEDSSPVPGDRLQQNWSDAYQ